MREFNVTGICVPNLHYMVDISDKVNQIAAMVEKGRYFTINRANLAGIFCVANAILLWGILCNTKPETQQKMRNVFTIFPPNSPIQEQTCKEKKFS
jgi:hypothetical protein